MKIKTHLFGEVSVSDDKIITFPKGLIGFEDKTKFMLVHEDDGKQKNHLSYTLQSVEVEQGSDCAEYALQIIDPTIFGFHYELELTDEETALLKNPNSEDVVFMQTVYKLDVQDKDQQGKGGNGLATNLLAPLIINVKERVGIQKLIEKVNTNVVFSNLTEEV